MIETIEEYTRARGIVANPDATMRDLAISLEKATHTIEALREVARAIHEYTHNAATQSDQLDKWQAIQDKLVALPDWLTE